MVRPARGCVSHVLVSEHRAAVFDPARHIETYHELAVGARIERMLDTHLHADHLSGGPALGQGDHIPYHLHPYDASHPMDMLPAHFSDIRAGDENGVFRATLGELKRRNPGLLKLARLRRPSPTTSWQTCPGFPRPMSRSSGPMPG